MKKIKYIFPIIILSIITACSTIKVSNINKSYNVKNYDFIYSLPYTSFDINIELTKETYVSGPYAKYAKKNLGIENISTKEAINWYITDINVSTIAKIDTTKYFVVQSKGLINSFSLTENGILESINTKSRHHDNIENDKFTTTPFSKEINYSNTIIKSPLKEKIDTTYRTVITDSTTRRIPVYSKRIVNKTIKDRAEEASLFIIKVRKRKFRVLTGLDKDFPDGEAVKEIIKELNKIEKEYLSLFIGEKIFHKYNYSYNVIPQKNKIDYVVCNFSKTKGIVSKDLGNEIVLKVRNNENTYKISKFLKSNKENLTKQEGIVYRQPEQVAVSIEVNNNIFYKNQLFIPQFGEILYLNKSFIKNKSISFDIKTGAIKCIE